MAARPDARIWLALGDVYLAWGSTFIALAIVVRDLPPLLSLAMRHFVAGAILLAFALPRGDREGDRIGWTQIRAGLIFGGLLFVLGHGSLAWAQQTVPAGVAALLVGSIPIWMALFDRVAFGRRLRGSAYVGFALGFVGLAFLVDPFGAGSSTASARSRSCWRARDLGRGLAVLARSAAADATARLRWARLALRRRPAHRRIARNGRVSRRGLLDGRAARRRLSHRRRELRRLHGVRLAPPASRRPRSSRRTRT